MVKGNTCVSCVLLALLALFSVPGQGESPEPPRLCVDSDCPPDTDGASSRVDVALTFEDRPAGTLPKEQKFDAEVATKQQYHVHPNSNGTVQIINDSFQACNGSKFLRSRMVGNQRRAMIVLNQPVTGGDLRAKETGWTSNRPDRWMGMCIRLASNFPYPSQGWMNVWATHNYGWLGEPVGCGPCIGLRAGSSGTGLPNGTTNWILKFEGDNNRSIDTGRDYNQDRGRWVSLVVHWVAGSEPHGRLKVWIDGEQVFDDVHHGGSVSTFSDANQYFAYEQQGLYNTYCDSNYCSEQMVDYDDIRYADGAVMSESEGYAAVNPENY